MTAPKPPAPAEPEQPSRHLQPGDLRAAARLATQATAGLVDLVESVHARIALTASRPASALSAERPERTRGLTGLVYKTVRGVTQVVGGSVDALLGWLQPVVTDPASGLATPEREAILAGLNGVLGDHLAATGSPLATTMALRSAGQALTLQADALAAALPAAAEPGGGRVLVLLHGLCMNDLQWQRAGHDHGAFLAREAGWIPLYLHHNSGLHIADNGQQLARLLAQLVAAWPQPITRLALLGHSMGGLVARSAIHAGQQAQNPADPFNPANSVNPADRAWTAQLTDLVCLGSPHHGAPLERAGHGVDLLLNSTPYSAPFARLGQLRSAGITDLRHGRLLASDGATAAQRSPVPLPAGVRCFTLAASLGQDSGERRHRVTHRLLGDGLVPLPSALGQHADPKFDLGFPPDRQWVGHGIGHLDLLGSQAVAAQLLRWLG